MSLDLHFKAYGLTPVKEHRFCKRKWRFDYAWPAQMVALEVEGGVYSGGRHVRGAGYTNDCRKYNEATRLGWRVFRVTSEMVRNGEAIDLIREVIDEEGRQGEASRQDMRGAGGEEGGVRGEEQQERGL